MSYNAKAIFYYGTTFTEKELEQIFALNYDQLNFYDELDNCLADYGLERLCRDSFSYDKDRIIVAAQYFEVYEYQKDLEISEKNMKVDIEAGQKIFDLLTKNNLKKNVAWHLSCGVV